MVSKASYISVTRLPALKATLYTHLLMSVWGQLEVAIVKMPRQGYRVRSQGCKPLGYADVIYKPRHVSGAVYNRPVPLTRHKNTN